MFIALIIKLRLELSLYFVIIDSYKALKLSIVFIRSLQI